MGASAELPQQVGAYEVLRALGGAAGEGGYLGWDARLARRVAIHPLHAPALSRVQRQQWLQREVGTAAGFAHPTLVEVYDVVQEPHRDFLVTEAVEGWTLAELGEAAPLPRSLLLDVARQIAEGLAAAHAHGLMHGELEPQAVVIAEDGAAKLLHFGAARAVRARGRGAGVPAARAECVSLDPSVDRLALGQLLQAALGGARAGAAPQPSRPQQPRRALPAPIAALLEELLAPGAQSRPLGALAQALRALAGELRPIPEGASLWSPEGEASATAGLRARWRSWWRRAAPHAGDAAGSAPEPADAQAWSTHARTLLWQQRHADAAAALRRALELDPERSDLRLQLGECCSAQGKGEQARAVLHGLRAALSRAAQLPALEQAVLAVCQARLGEPRRAVRTARAALERTAGDAAVQYLAALAFQGVGDQIQAQIAAERALAHGLAPLWCESSELRALPPRALPRATLPRRP